MIPLNRDDLKMVALAFIVSGLVTAGVAKLSGCMTKPTLQAEPTQVVTQCYDGKGHTWVQANAPCDSPTPVVDVKKPVKTPSGVVGGAGGALGVQVRWLPVGIMPPPAYNEFWTTCNCDNAIARPPIH